MLGRATRFPHGSWNHFRCNLQVLTWWLVFLGARAGLPFPGGAFFPKYMALSPIQPRILAAQRRGAFAAGLPSKDSFKEGKAGEEHEMPLQDYNTSKSISKPFWSDSQSSILRGRIIIIHHIHHIHHHHHHHHHHQHHQHQHQHHFKQTDCRLPSALSIKPFDPVLQRIRRQWSLFPLFIWFHYSVRLHALGTLENVSPSDFSAQRWPTTSGMQLVKQMGISHKYWFHVFHVFWLKAKSHDVSMVSVGVPWAVPVSHPQNLLERAANLQKGGSLTMLGLSGAGRAIGLSSSWGYALDEIHHIWRCLVLSPKWTRWWFYVFCCFLLGTVVIWEWVAPIPPDKGAEECGPGYQGKISKWTEFHSLWWLLNPR